MKKEIKDRYSISTTGITTIKDISSIVFYMTLGFGILATIITMFVFGFMVSLGVFLITLVLSFPYFIIQSFMNTAIGITYNIQEQSKILYSINNMLKEIKETKN